MALVFGFTLLLTITTKQPFLDVMFEAVSALCTVGSVSDAGHFVLMGAMLVGRFGSLMLVLYMNKPRRQLSYHHPVDSVRLG